ncbi:PAS domain-containing protein [Thermoleptolyngbya oregonensis NK1-22]|uniref:histidine kinase n=1 Tax=Thermoleptolyngbya oregonensis NK1-22 TaxID=2547457 RepID=A0AA97BKJ4_9CYAN|nr:PAS domain-containing protein [Thermoleptolyngbya oregonensis NK1-22]
MPSHLKPVSDRPFSLPQPHGFPNPLTLAAHALTENGVPEEPDGLPSNPSGESSLGSHELKLWQLFDSLPVCLAYVDANQRCRFMNRTYEVWMERRREELYGKSVREVIGEAAYQLAAPFIEQALSGKSVHYEAELPHAIGKPRPVSVLLVPDWDETQQVRGYYALVTDISDRKALEHTSKQTALQLQEVLNRACAAVTSFRLYADLSWDYDYRSPGSEALFGYSAEELMADQQLWMSRLLPDDRQKILTLNQTKLLQGEPVTFEYRFFHKDGSLRWFSSAASSFYSPHDHCWRVTAVEIDISHRKQTEEALRQSQTRLKTAQTVARIGNWELDLETRRITWSDQMYEIHGVERAQGEPSYPELLQKFVPEDRMRLDAAVSNAIALGQPYILDLRLSQPNGSISYLESRGQAEIDASGRVVKLYGTTQDITERKQLEIELKQRSQREQMLNQVIQAIRRSLNLPTIFETAVRETAALLHLSSVSIVKYLASEACWLLQAEYVPPGSPARHRPGLRIPHRGNPLAEQLAQGQLVKLSDNRQAGGSFNQTLAAEMPARWLLVPLKIGETVWGSLSLTRELSLDPWQDWEVEVAQGVADQLAIAIQQSELFHQVQLLNTTLETQVQRRTTQLQQAIDLEARLKRITDKVRDSLDEHQILQTAVTELGLGLGVERCQAGIYDLTTQTLTIYYEYRSHAQMASSQGLVVPLIDLPEVHRAILAGQFVQVCCLETLPGLSATGESMPPEPTHREVPHREVPHREADAADVEVATHLTEQPVALLVCPILHDQQVLGSLWLFKPGQEAFRELETRLVQQVANQCAIALRQSRLYQSAQRQVDELARLNHLKDDFLNTVSHELRSPMSSIKMSAEMLEILLQRKGVFDDPQISQYFKILQSECDRETRLINDLLDLSRLTANTEPLLLTTLELRSWILHVAEPFVSRARSQQQNLHFHLPTEPLFVTTDFSYLEQVFTELLQNACKYTPTNETICVSARLEDLELEALEHSETESAQLPHPASPHYAIHITNTGITIPEPERDRIFEKFYRIPNSDPWKHSGTGLGLALARRRVEQIHGSLSVSGDRHSTTFTIRLPLLPPDLSAEAEE